LQAEVVKYKDENGNKLEREWFLQTLEAFANVVVGVFGLYVLEGGPSKMIPWKGFALSGTTQVGYNIFPYIKRDPLACIDTKSFFLLCMKCVCVCFLYSSFSLFKF
jgi:hypothetical protein